MDFIEKHARVHLNREINEIETSNRKLELPELSVYEKAIIYKYSNDGYDSVNEKLRISEGKETIELGKLLRRVINKLPSYVGLVYRGANLTSIEIRRYEKALKLNNGIKEFSFLSCTHSRLIAMAFRGNVFFRIFSKTGKSVDKVTKFGFHGNSNEKEVIIVPNRNFNVLEVVYASDYTTITMEEI